VLESDELRIRIASVRLGAASTVALALVGIAYYFSTWERPDRPLMTMLAAGFAVLGAVLAVRPIAAAVVDRPNAVFFSAWSTFSTGGIAVLFYLDGAARSPIAFGFVLALAFAGLVFPLRGAIAVAALVEANYVLAALARPHRVMDVAFVIVALLCTAVMCVWTAWWRDRQRRELMRLSITDPLTGCLNRRGIEDAVERALDRGAPFALVTLDLDGLKQVNDRDGHAAGDAVLCRAVRILREVVRPTDCVGRLGGDEFALLLPGAGPDAAGAVLDRAVLALASAAPASFGLAAFPRDGSTGDALFSYADAGVYSAKAKRNAPRVVRTAF
jgi:diguanylate cyclase (GGDEF)-like protein